MDARTFTAADTRPAAATALMVAAGSAATVVGALYFQHVLNYLPCPLCFTQRYFHYAAIPLALVVAAAAYFGAQPRLIRGGLALLALVLAGGAAVGVYHSGVEWGWWPGPQDCSGPLNQLGGGNLLQQLQSINVVRCDEAPWRFLGLSFAGWNVVISLALAAVAVFGAGAAGRGRRVGKGAAEVSRSKR
jgi:disulfide bond formation protein DsbB